MENKDQNPYDSPKAQLIVDIDEQVPKEILKKIKIGWIAALISGVFTLGIMILAISTGSMSNLFDIWTTIDVVLIFALTIGIYKKSRISATTMFVYFLFSKIWFITQTGEFNGMIMALLFLYFYFQAMVGTYQYHNVIKILDNR